MSSLFSNKKELWAILLILAAVSLSYFNAVSNGFALDDVPLVQKNPLVMDWRNTPAVFASEYWASTGGDSGGLYRPLTIFSYLVEHSIAGLDPTLYHLDNIGLHFLCCLLVFIIARRVTGNEPGSLIAALLFAVHPAHVEAVANISGRSELLASLFTLLGLHTFMNPPKRVPWYIISPFLLMLGLLSKETAVVLPVLILVYLLAFERDGRGKDIRRITASLAPYVVITAAFILLRFYILGADAYPKDTGQVLVNTKGYWRMLVMFKVFLKYMQLSFFPVDLHAHYMLRPPNSILSVTGVLFLGIVGSFAAASPWLIKNKPIHFFAVWFVITLLPVSNIIPVGILMSERALYLPLVSFCVLSGLLFSWAGGALQPVTYKSKTVVSIVIAVLLIFGVLTHNRNKVWHDPDTIDVDLIESYAYVIDQFPESGLYHFFTAASLHSLKRYDESAAYLKKAAELEPGVIGHYIQLAEVYCTMERHDLALPVVEKALSLPTDDLHSEVYAMFAEVYYMNGMTVDAERCINKALSMDDIGNNFVAAAKIAVNIGNMKRFEEAESYMRRAIELNPYVGDYHLHYAHILANTGRGQEALEELNKATKLDPGSPEAYFQQGMILGRMEKYDAAVKALKTAANLNPNDPQARYYLAVAYIGAGLFDEAAEELEMALRLKPNYVEARELLDQRP